MEALNPGGLKDSASALTVLPSLRDDISSAPRMLTPSEISWLRQNKQAALEALTQLARERMAQEHAA